MRSAPLLFAFLSWVSLSLALTGCFGQKPEIHRSLQQPLTAPTKDEVALVDGRPLSLTAFVLLRSRLKSRSVEAALWVGIAALAIQNSTRAAGRELDPTTAVDIARYAMGEIGAAEAAESLRLYFASPGPPPTPQQTRREMERLLASSLVRRNDHVLASLN